MARARRSRRGGLLGASFLAALAVAPASGQEADNPVTMLEPYVDQLAGANVEVSAIRARIEDLKVRWRRLSSLQIELDQLSEEFDDAFQALNTAIAEASTAAGLPPPDVGEEADASDTGAGDAEAWNLSSGSSGGAPGGMFPGGAPGQPFPGGFPGGAPGGFPGAPSFPGGMPPFPGGKGGGPFGGPPGGGPFGGPPGGGGPFGGSPGGAGPFGGPPGAGAGPFGGAGPGRGGPFGGPPSGMPGLTGMMGAMNQGPMQGLRQLLSLLAMQGMDTSSLTAELAPIEKDFQRLQELQQQAAAAAASGQKTSPEMAAEVKALGERIQPALERFGQKVQSMAAGSMGGMIGGPMKPPAKSPFGGN